MTAGIEASSRVLHQANAAVDRELRSEALADLCARVDDWKNHRVDQFGELLLHGQFPVVTGKTEVTKDVRPQVRPQSGLARNPNSTPAPSLSQKSDTLRLSAPFRKALGAKWLQSIVTSCRDKEADAGCEVTPLDQAENQQSNTRQFDASDLDLFLRNTVFHHLSYYSNPRLSHNARELRDSFLSEQYANMMGLVRPAHVQYTIYLFERILLCCKDLNPNKSKDKLLDFQKDKKDKKDKKNKDPKATKLQLKGRIFMTNVTEVLSLSKQGTTLPSGEANHSNNRTRFIFCSDILERRPRSRKFRYSLLQ